MNELFGPFEILEADTGGHDVDIGPLGEVTVAEEQFAAQHFLVEVQDLFVVLGLSRVDFLNGEVLYVIVQVVQFFRGKTWGCDRAGGGAPGSGGFFIKDSISKVW